MSIEKTTGYTSNGTDYFTSLDEAKLAALEAVFDGMTAPTRNVRDLAEFVTQHADAIVEILATKHRGRPRKSKVATKMRKARLATAPLPLEDQPA